LIAALWGLTNLTLSLTKELNTLRDRVLQAGDEKCRLTFAHRKLIATNDWLPTLLSLILVSFGFAFVVLTFPTMVEGSTSPLTYCVAYVGFIPAFVGVMWTIAGFKDWKAMQKALCEAGKAEVGNLARDSKSGSVTPPATG
jgi:hypothetical protein